MDISNPEKLTNNPWLNLFRVDWNNKGASGEWIFTSRKESPLEVFSEPDAVIIVPIHVQKNLITGNDYKRLVVVREFRIPLNGYEYGFPAGLKIPGETVTTCAIRELKEETGLTLRKVNKVSPIIYSSSGLTDESVVMIFCECSGDVSGENRESSEEMSVHLLDLDQLAKFCNNYTVKQSSRLWPVLMMFNMIGSFNI